MIRSDVVNVIDDPSDKLRIETGCGEQAVSVDGSDVHGNSVVVRRSAR